ncbi:MAG: hypothetical protein P9M12_01240 [Candidatus Aceula lacicola]|nr:hypothetical protein [Candidatus Aceula lacicola]
MAENKKLSRLADKKEDSSTPYKVVRGRKVLAKKEYLSGNSTHFRYVWDG